MSQYVKFTVPKTRRDLGNADVVFEAWDDHGKIGRLRISKGAVEWYAKSKRSGKPNRRLTWHQFSKLMATKG
jgi:hypothetical protein